MDKFIIVNTNPNHNAQSESADCVSPCPHWLAGQYIHESGGTSSNDIYGALLYVNRNVAESRARILNKKFQLGGEYFVGRTYQTGYPYPEFCGEAKYEKYAPEYEVRRVTISIKITD